MKHLALSFLFAFALAAGAACVPAVAGPCVVLDYQEMKDMSIDDLTRAYCTAGKTRRANMDDVLSNLRATGGQKPFPAASDNFEQCTGQLERIERVLASKGVLKDAMKSICTQQPAK